MRILGIDPGLKTTGYGLIDLKQQKVNLIEAGIVEPKKTDGLPKKVDTVFLNLQKIIEEYNPDLLVLEKLYAHHAHPSTAFILGHVRGVICLLCAQKNVILEEYSVKRIRKAITGNGNATKVQTRRIVAHILKVDEEKLTLDASDALALALGHAHMAVGKIAF